ncbi:MAG: acyl-CoA carboxylase subunit beta [Jatrophihabitantaceae bacterium]
MTVNATARLPLEPPAVLGLAPALDTGAVQKPLAPSRPSEARRRIELLADPHSFCELGSAALHRTVAFEMAAKRPSGDGVVTGSARIDGRQVAVFSQDVSALGGSLGEVHASKISRVLDYAARSRVPVVGLLDSGGARIQEATGALDGYGAIFRRNVALSGRVPQLSVVLGSCAGGAVYSPALTDVVIMSTDARMFLTGPSVVKAVTHEDVSPADLGGPAIHGAVSGVAHLVASDDAEAIRLAAKVLDYLPSSCWSPLPTSPAVEPDELADVPDNHRKPYDVRGVIRGIVDTGSFLELQRDFARNLVIGFGRVGGLPVGLVANQPMMLAGCLDIAASEKGARFVRTCDAFGLPLVVLVDTPGFLPGTGQERDGIIRKGAKLLYAFAEATVPRVTVVLRKAFGGAYIVMNSRSLGADAVFAWPGAELAVMGAEGAVQILWRRELAREPECRQALIEQYRSQAMSAKLAAERLSVDEIITPKQTPHRIAATLRALQGSVQPEFRHDNLPQ